MGGQETKEKTFFVGVDPSKHHVIILGTDIPVLHSFLLFYKTQQINKLVKKC